MAVTRASRSQPTTFKRDFLKPSGSVISAMTSCATRSIFPSQIVQKRLKIFSSIKSRRTEQIGKVGKNSWISVADSVTDLFSYVQCANEIGWQYILRVNQDIKITTSQGDISNLKA